MELIKLAIIGIALGITTVIPGISTGTIAVVFNVYDRLIGIITPNIKKILAEWKFWLPLVVGGFAGIILSSKVISLLFQYHPLPIYWFFIGIIAGSIPLIYRRVHTPEIKVPALPSVICAVLAFAVMAVMGVFSPAENTATYTELTPQVFGILAAGGALAAIAMIIPGISGSFLLLIVGLLPTFTQAVSEANILLLIPILLGAIVGVIVGAALVRFLLAKAPRETYGAVLGLVAGSIVLIFFKFVLHQGGFGSGVTIIFSVASLLVGGAISVLSGREKNTSEISSEE